MKLNIKAFALAFGLLWGAGIFLLTWWLIITGGSTGEPTFIGRVYLGYSVSPLGSVVGLLWGLVDGLISAAVFAWLYNLLATRLACPACEGGKAEEPQAPSGG